MTEIDKWEYFDYKGKTIVVNVFNYDEVASPDNIQVNVYRFLISIYSLSLV